MPQPTASDVHVSVPLTDVSIATVQDIEGFVASKVAPIIKVQKESNKYWVYPKGAWFRPSMQRRGESEESVGTGWQVESDDTYFCEPFALHTDIGDRTRANADSVFSLDEDAGEFLTQQFLLTRDMEWADKQFKAGVWSVDVTTTTKWNVGGSTPIESIRAEILAQRKRAGIRPKTLVLGAEAWNVLVDHAEFLERVGGGATTDQPAMVKRQLLAQLLELDEVIIAEATYNAGAEGKADDFNFICGKHALLLYVNPRPGMKKPSAAYTFVWDTFAAGPDGQKISKYRQDLKKSDRLEIEANWDFKVISPDNGTFFPDVVS